jgi:hypothetical protein
MQKKIQMEAEMLSNTRIVIKRIILSQKIRQAQIEVANGSLSNARIDPASETHSWLKSFQDALAWLKERQFDLKNRLSTWFGPVWSGANRDASAWRVFRAEYGPDETLTRDIGLGAKSFQRQRFVDHYQRRV